MLYELIDTLSGEFAISTLCSVLEASRTAYYRYKRGGSYQPTARREEKRLLVERVFGVHKRRYGSRRIVAELQQNGHNIGRRQVRSIMKDSGLRPIQPKSFVPRTTDSTHGKGYCGTAHAAKPAAGSTAAHGSRPGLAGPPGG